MIAKAEIIHSNLKYLEENIILACENVGRDSSEIKILPVTKTRTIDEIKIIQKLGFNEFGENLVKEAKEKFYQKGVGLDFTPEWIMIGHLQSNKVRAVAKYAKEVHSIDSLRIAQLLDIELKKLNKKMNSLIQVNTSREESKYGFSADSLIEDLKELVKLKNINFKGFMTLAIHSDNISEIRSCFKLLKELQGMVNSSSIFDSELTRLSMGMSSDYKIAIEEGATELRLGQAIFGPRSQPNSVYWPG